MSFSRISLQYLVSHDHPPRSGAGSDRESPTSLTGSPQYSRDWLDVDADARQKGLQGRIAHTGSVRELLERLAARSRGLVRLGPSLAERCQLVGLDNE